MNIKTKLLLLLGMMLANTSMATIVVPSQNFPLQRPAAQSIVNVNVRSEDTSFMLFQVVTDQITLDNSTIRRATLLEHGGIFKGLILELKPEAINTMAALTYANLGRAANLIFNKKIISTTIIHSPLGGSILLTGLTKAEAQAFLAALNKKK